MLQQPDQLAIVHYDRCRDHGRGAARADQRVDFEHAIEARRPRLRASAHRLLDPVHLFTLIREGLVLVGVRGAAASMARVARKAARSLVRGWASCLGRIFEVDVIKCARCGGTMKAIASIRDDVELERLLRHVGLDADFPKTRPARAPPAAWAGEGSQVDPTVDAWDGKDAQPADD